jgi:hypothetical protein
MAWSTDLMILWKICLMSWHFHASKEREQHFCFYRPLHHDFLFFFLEPHCSLLIFILQWKCHYSFSPYRWPRMHILFFLAFTFNNRSPWVQNISNSPSYKGTLRLITIGSPICYNCNLGHGVTRPDSEGNKQHDHKFAFQYCIPILVLWLLDAISCNRDCIVQPILPTPIRTHSEGNKSEIVTLIFVLDATKRKISIEVLFSEIPVIFFCSRWV